MQSDTRSFIVRIWREALNSDANIRTWRGSVERVGNGQRLYSCELEWALRFIQEQAEFRTRQAGPRWRSLLARMKRGI